MISALLGIIAFALSIPFRSVAFMSKCAMISIEKSTEKRLKQNGKKRKIGQVVDKLMMNKRKLIKEMDTSQKLRYKVLQKTYLACKAIANVLSGSAKVTLIVAMVVILILILLIVVVAGAAGAVVSVVMNSDSTGSVIYTGGTVNEQEQIQGGSNVDNICKIAQDIADTFKPIAPNYGTYYTITIGDFGEHSIRADCSGLCSTIINAYCNTYIDSFKEANDWTQTDTSSFVGFAEAKGCFEIIPVTSETYDQTLQKGDIVNAYGSGTHHVQMCIDIKEDGTQVWINGGSSKAFLENPKEKSYNPCKSGVTVTIIRVK